MTSPYIAKRVQAGIPIWDITAHGQDIGSLTDLPMENTPMATVRYYCDEVTFAAPTIREVLALVGDHLREMDALMEEQADEAQAIYDAEYYAEVIGPMKAAEDLAERYGTGYGDEDPIW